MMTGDSPLHQDDIGVEVFLREVFEQNYELLKLESGTALAPEVRETAWQQVLLYWRKMRGVAETVTDAEVPLSLPGAVSPAGRHYTVEGVVDIVRDDSRTIMYDIKTHDADVVRANPDIYMRQLNVYAHIWQELRGQVLDEAGIICTDFPAFVKEALESRDPEQLTRALGEWQPLIEVPYDPGSIDATMQEFGEVVDAIEGAKFAPPGIEVLQNQLGTSTQRFATRVCRNCDARFSCGAYRQYARHGRGQIEKNFRQYFGELVGGGEEATWLTAGLDEAADATDLRADMS